MILSRNTRASSTILFDKCSGIVSIEEGIEKGFKSGSDGTLHGFLPHGDGYVDPGHSIPSLRLMRLKSW